MTTWINLAYPEKSPIKINSFPDGQHSVDIIKTPNFMNENDFHISEEGVEIWTRLTSWTDLEILCSTVASLRELKVKYIEVYISYFLGARSDRKFKMGGSNYLKDVICPVINSLKLDKVQVYDPHSHCLEMGLNNYESYTNERLVNYVLEDLKTDNYVLMAVDAGGAHRVNKIAEKIGYKGRIITCMKERDGEGNLTQTVVPITVEDQYKKNFILIDDISDYGTSFTNIAKELLRRSHELNNPTDFKLHLVVSHTIQDAGIDNVLDYFDTLYTTNSFKDRESTDKLKIVKVI